MTTLISKAKRVTATNQHYQLSIDQAKNRAYITIIGFWRSPQEVATYVQDLDKALTQLRAKFTLLTDLRSMKTHPKEVQQLHLEAQQLLLSKGLLQTAEVYESSFIQFQTSTLSKESKMPLKQFTSIEMAEEYLDSFFVN
ncbi:hypothetical protein Q0590_34715 [Rhodocytophaga aerolata]|uniref:Uncharacterized protein n=1 Tax=Rhodocytophaga aerolata TaxID=455078 RepID=A0ABT8RJ88_9BACT|nr:hypothetical protein [Rhodocytophaga aerolata]MDO1451479.1 hypothetical protein [Rhodocytophaga aerolata]